MQDKDIARLYRLAFVEGFSGEVLVSMIFPILIFMAFKSEFSLGSLKSVFAILSMIVSYMIGSKVKGDKIMKMTSIALFLFLSLPDSIKPNDRRFI